MSIYFKNIISTLVLFVLFLGIGASLPQAANAQPYCWCKKEDGTCSQHGARVGESPRQVTQCGDAPSGASETDRLTYCNTYCISRGLRAVHCEPSYRDYYRSDSTADERNRCTPSANPPGGSTSTSGGGSSGLGDGGEDRTSPSDFGLQNPLGTTDFRSIMSRIIRAVLGVVGALFLAMFVYGGVKWMISTDAKGIDSAKKILVNAVVGMVIVSFSYSMVAIIFSLAGQVTRGG